jgi:hypothetical protein
VINRAVVEAFEGLWVDSLATFLSVKCLFDHDMSPREEILLGGCEAARQALRLGLKPLSQPGKNSSSSGAAAASSTAGGAGAKPGGASKSSSGQ